MTTNTSDPHAYRALLARISEHNRAEAIHVLRGHANRGLKAASLYTKAQVLVQLDDLSHGQPWTRLTAADLADIIEQWRRHNQDSTVQLKATVARQVLAELRGEDKLPPDLDKALRVLVRQTPFAGNVLTNAQHRALLDAAPVLDGIRGRGPGSVQAVALLQVLRHGGLRAREALALNVGSVLLDDMGAELRLPRDAPYLKTGARDVYVAEPAPALRAWLSIHPAGSEANAPLFIGLQDRTGNRRLGYAMAAKMARHLSEEAGIAPTLRRPLRLHDFRHTCATEKARLGWNEAKMRNYFGWSEKSSMPARYSHLAASDLRDQVLADARRSVPVDFSNEAALSDLLRRIVQGNGGTPQGKI